MSDSGTQIAPLGRVGREPQAGDELEPVSAPDAATAVQTPSRPPSSLANLAPQVVQLLETRPDLLTQFVDELAAIVPPTFLATERKR